MRRYTGSEVKPGARIAVIANDAVGNFVVSTPLLQMLRQELRPASLHYFGGRRTLELQSASSLIDQDFPLHGTPPKEAAAWVGQHEYDLVVNLEWTSYAKTFTAMLCGSAGYVAGPCLDEGGRADLPFQPDERGALWTDKEWISEDLPSRYPFLHSSFIGELFCRLLYLKGTVPPYLLPQEAPEAEVPDVLIAMSASLPEKLWHVESWIQVLGEIKSRGYSIGLLGAKPGPQSQFWRGAQDEQYVVESGLAQDLRGIFSLPQVVGALSTAKAVLSLDNGIMHLAAGSRTPTVALFRHGIHRLWLPPSDNIRAITPGEGRSVSEIATHEVTRELLMVLERS